MSLQLIIVIILSLVVGIGYLYKIRSYDQYEKESYSKLLTVAILGGIISVAISLLAYTFIKVKENFLDAIFKIGVVEEISKFISLISVYYLIKKEFNEISDGIIYIATIALGFSIIENIMYLVRSDDPFLLLFQRSLFSVIGHISFSGYMGIAFFIHIKVRKNYTGILLAIIIAALAHGIYDGIIFQKEIQFLFKIFFFMIVFLQFRLFKLSLGFSQFRESLTETTFKETDKIVFLNCCSCEDSVRGKEVRFGEIRAGICERCNNIVFDSDNMMKLFKYFRPIIQFDNFLKKIPENKRIITLDNNSKIFFNTKRRFLSANTEELGKWLDYSNNEDRLKILNLPFIGSILKSLGMKYIVKN